MNHKIERDEALAKWQRECEGNSVPVTPMMRHAYRDGWADARAGQSAGVPIYQVTEDDDAWHDTDWTTYDSASNDSRRIVYAAAPAPVSAPSPDREQVGSIEAAVTKLTADFARVGEAFMDLCSELGCPDNTNMLDWARGRMTCDACYGTGRVFVGNSGRESDGNAPEFERCPSCGYGDASPSRECGEPPFFWHRVIRILVEQGVRWKQDGWVFQSDDDLHKFALAVIGAKGE